MSDVGYNTTVERDDLEGILQFSPSKNQVSKQNMLKEPTKK